MNAARKRYAPTQTPSAQTIALRERVQELEIAREEACMLRDREAVELIDKEIKALVAEWSSKFAVERMAAQLKKTA